MAQILVPAAVLPSLPMPQVCARTGEPTTRTRKVQATWVPLWSYLLLVLGLIPFAIVYFAVAKRVEARVPVARSASRRRSLGAVLVVLSSLPLLVGVIGVLTEPSLGFALVLVASAGAFAGGVVLQMGSTIRCRWAGEDIRISRIHPAFATALQGQLDQLRARSLAGWFPDPSMRHELRWFDGARWTEHVSTRGLAAISPVA